MEIFRNSRMRLTLIFSAIMFAFLIVLIVGVQKVMYWSFDSEQKRELSDAANNIAEAQAYQIQHPNVNIDEALYYRNTNDRLFFYVFDQWGQLVGFVRASFRVEPFILEYMNQEQIPGGSNVVFSYPNENGRMNDIMMTSRILM